MTFLQFLLVCIGAVTVSWLAGCCIRDMLRNVPDRLPRNNVRSQRYQPGDGSRWWV